VKPKRIKLKRVSIVAKHHAKEIASVLITLVEWLEARGVTTYLESALAPLVGARKSFSLSKLPRDADVFIVLGGDGTLLSVARAMGSRQFPILGVNLGNLGFLTDVAVKDLYSTLEAISEGQAFIDSRMMLNAELVRKGEVLLRDIILNDVVITKGAIARIIEVAIDVDDQFVAVIRADGIIVSTPTGSTAYSLAAGGPILHPTLEAMILTPICPHTLTYRPVVLSDQVTIELTLRGDPGEVFLTFDGQASEPLEPGDVIRVRKSRYGVKLLSLPDQNYFKVLRHKLRWAERPRSRRHTPPPTP
jgi:NAD+ kinase